MKKLLLLMFGYLSFVNFGFAQCDIANNGLGVFPSPISIGQTSIFTFTISNQGSDQNCAYGIIPVLLETNPDVKVTFSLPANGYVFDGFVFPAPTGANTATGNYFNWVYDPMTRIVTGRNHSIIPWQAGEFDIKIKVKGTSASFNASILNIEVLNGASNNTGNDLASASLRVRGIAVVANPVQILCGATTGSVVVDLPANATSPFKITGPGITGFVTVPAASFPYTIDPVPAGTHIYTVTDANNNSGTASVTINPAPIVPNASVSPTSFVLDCNTPTKELVTSGGGTYQWSANAMNANTPNITVSAAGTYIVTVTGANGCTATASSVITFKADTEKPKIVNCPTFLDLQMQPISDLFISTGPTSTTCDAKAEWTPPTATDNCKVKSLTYATSPTVGLLNGGLFPVGTTLVTYTATDDAGNTSTCTFNVVVGDNTAPVITDCPVEPISAMTTINDTECSTIVEIPQINIFDNCAKTLKIAWDITGATTINDMGELTSTNGIFAVNFTFLFKVGTSNVVVTFEDEAGNSNICEFDVNVTDGTAPIITKCPAKQTIEGCSTSAITIPYSEVDQTVTSTVFASAGGTATDNCEIKTISYKDSKTGTCPIVVNRVWTVTDAAGLTASCTQIIEIDDNTAPNLKINAVLPSGMTGINDCKSAAPVGPTEAEIKALYEDNCSAVTVIKSGALDAQDTDCNWSVTYTYIIKDDCQNLVTPQVEITYSGGDNTPPTVVFPANFFDANPPVTIDMNNNVNFNTPSTECRLNVVFGKPTVNDNCTSVNNIVTTVSAKDKDGNPILVFFQNPTYSADFPIGKNTLTFEVSDNCNKTTTKTITVTIIDNIKPVTPILPDIIGCGPVVAPTTKDNCTILVTGTTTDPTEYYKAGVYTINWVFTDDAGNSTTATQKLTVVGSGVVAGSVVKDTTPLNLLVDGAVQPSLVAHVSMVKGSTIIATVPLASGLFTLPDVCPGTYNIVLHTTPAGSISPQLPVGYGGFGGEGPLNGSPDTNPNGIASVTISSGALIYNNARAAAGGDVSFALAPQSLPVRLISFIGKSTEKGNELNWETSSESNFSHYEVEKSSDAKAFKMLGKVSGAGNTTEKIIYLFIDDLNENQATGMVPGASSSLISHNSSLNYYRLKMVDLDGSSEYSKVIFIENENGNTTIGEFYPNPAFGSEVSINITSGQADLWAITQYDLTGRVINTETRQLNKGENKLKFETKVKRTGVTIYRFENANGIQFRKLNQ